MSYIKLDISNIYYEVLSIGSTTGSACAKIREVMAERGLSQRDIHRMCFARFEAGLTDYCPSHQTVHKFLAGKSVNISYDMVVALIEALGYEMCGSRARVESEAIKVIDTEMPMPALIPVDRSKNFKSRRRVTQKREPHASN